MSRKFMVVALVAASSFVCFTSESEASFLRRGKRAGGRSYSAAQACTCNTGYQGYQGNQGYSASATPANYGYAVPSQMGYDQGQTAVYGGVNSMVSPSMSGGAAQVGYSSGQQTVYGAN